MDDSIEVLELRNPAPPAGVLYSFAPKTVMCRCVDSMAEAEAELIRLFLN